jgi:hypothetical protein
VNVSVATRDHALVVQAAHAYRIDQPDYARTLLARCGDPLTAAVQLVGLLMQERSELKERGVRL